MYYYHYIEETIGITYSYWDGSGHRKSVQCKKGDSIAQFLEACRQQFPQLRGVNVDNLIYVKEDLIIPHVRKENLNTIDTKKKGSKWY